MPDRAEQEQEQVPQEAVEAAAKWLYEEMDRSPLYGSPSWSKAAPSAQKGNRQRGRDLLTAAYPAIKAQVEQEVLGRVREALAKIVAHRRFTGFVYPGTRETQEEIAALLASLSPDQAEKESIPRSYWREVPCGHPPDPVAMFGRDGEPVCHCGWILDQQDGVEIEEAPGPIVHCQNCGCYVAVPPKPPTEQPTGECKVAMSGPTCMDPDCPPCRHPEMEPVAQSPSEQAEEPTEEVPTDA